MKLNTFPAVGLALLACILSSPATAQVLPLAATDSASQTATRLRTLRDRLVSLDELDLSSVRVASPGMSSSTPVAQSSGGTTVGVWVSFQARTRYTSNPDGAVGLGVGFGDSKKTLR